MSRDLKRQRIEEGIRLFREAEAANQRFDAVAAGVLGINRTDSACLGIVEYAGGSITAGRLAELAGLTTAAITAVVDRLEAKGYVRRVRDERDRRRVLIELTPKLRERAEPIWGPLAEESLERLSQFTGAELAAIHRFFEFSLDLNERHTERIRHLKFD